MIYDYFVYMMTNKNNTVIYTGVTNNIIRSVAEHRDDKSSFTKRYKLYKLVYFERFTDPESAIQREKQIKAGSRAKKITLIEKNNSNCDDISNEL